MKTKAIKAGFAVSALALAISPAMAAEIRFDGFASIVAGQVLDKDEVGSSGEFNGFDNRLSFQENSVFALQARAALQERLTATAQIIAKGSQDYDARFNWAFLAYELTDSVTLKAGRFRTPMFMFSDFLDVGYAYHWIAPPQSVYEVGGYDSSDGVMVEHQTNFGSWHSNLALTIGRTSQDLEDGGLSGHLETTNAWLVSWSMNYDWLTLRLVHSQSEITADVSQLNELADGMRNLFVSESAISSMLIDSDRSEYSGLGINMDNGKYFLASEITEIKTDGNFTADKKTAWYVSAGMRFGDWTVYGTVENIDAGIDEKSRDNLLAEFDAGEALLQMIYPTLTPEEQFGAGMLLAAAPQLRGGISHSFNQSMEDKDIYSVGVRYNFHPSAALKFEYMEMKDKLNDLQPAAVAVAIDLVY